MNFVWKILFKRVTTFGFQLFFTIYYVFCIRFIRYDSRFIVELVSLEDNRIIGLNSTFWYTELSSVYIDLLLLAVSQFQEGLFNFFFSADLVKAQEVFFSLVPERRVLFSLLARIFFLKFLSPREALFVLRVLFSRTQSRCGSFLF